MEEEEYRVCSAISYERGRLGGDPRFVGFLEMAAFDFGECHIQPISCHCNHSLPLPEKQHK